MTLSLLAQHMLKLQRTRARVNRFADRHPRFDELGDLIEQEVIAGYSLAEAYRRAALLRPRKQRKARKVRSKRAAITTAIRMLYRINADA